MTGLSDGGWLVTWTSVNQDRSFEGVYQQRYDRNGNTVDGEQRVNVVTSNSQWHPSATGLKNGGWVVTWASIGQDDIEDRNGEGIFQSHYAEDGTVTVT